MTISETLAWGFVGALALVFVATCVSNQKRTKAMRDELQQLQKSLHGSNDVLIKLLEFLERLLKT